MLNSSDEKDDMLEGEEAATLESAICRHWVSELMEEYGYRDNSDVYQALLRSFEVCCTMNIPIGKNFQRVFRYQDNVMQVDWHISDLGCYLLTINGNSINPHVAKAQLHAILSSKAKPSAQAEHA